MGHGDGKYVATSRDERPRDHWCGHGCISDGEDVVASDGLLPGLDRREATEDYARIGERDDRADRERLSKELVTQLGGATNRAQGRVQQRHPGAEPLRLLEAVGGEGKRHPPPAGARLQGMEPPPGGRGKGPSRWSERRRGG